MRHFSGSLLLSVVFCALVACRADEAQPPVNQDELVRQEASRQFEYFDCLAEKFEGKLKSGERLQLAGKPLLKWTLGTAWHGSFYVWTSNDRPVLVGGFLADSENKDRRRSFVEMHSMADDPIEPISFAGTKNHVWTPDTKRIAALAVSNSSDPGRSSRLRGTQMRDLAAEFAVTLIEDDGKQELRLMPRPLYRFSTSDTAAVDGAIFAFVNGKGTDPEFLLAIECNLKASKPEWKARPMRFSTAGLELRRESKIVWSVPKYRETNERTSLTDPYVIVMLAETSTSKFNALRKSVLDDRNK